MKKKLQKISVIILSYLSVISCTSVESYDDTGETTGFPDSIVSNDFPLGKTHLLGQTPIDITTSTTTKISTTDPVIHYGSINLSSVENTGENLKINLSPAESSENYITIKGYKYELQQFHFHRHSEHKINGEYSTMEIHFVNKSSTGAYAVLGILVKNGEMSPSLQVLFNASPSDEGINSVPNQLHINTLLPQDISSYYTYSGSLTTPNLNLVPNQGPLTWVLFKNTISLSPGQLEYYSLKYKEENFRVIQPLNNRTVYENKK